jgi:hypothetical protein
VRAQRADAPGVRTEAERCSWVAGLYPQFPVPDLTSPNEPRPHAEGPQRRPGFPLLAIRPQTCRIPNPSGWRMTNSIRKATCVNATAKATTNPHPPVMTAMKARRILNVSGKPNRCRNSRNPVAMHAVATGTPRLRTALRPRLDLTCGSQPARRQDCRLPLMDAAVTSSLSFATLSLQVLREPKKRAECKLLSVVRVVGTAERVI